MEAGETALLLNIDKVDTLSWGNNGSWKHNLTKTYLSTFSTYSKTTCSFL